MLTCGQLEVIPDSPHMQNFHEQERTKTNSLNYQIILLGSARAASFQYERECERKFLSGLLSVSGARARIFVSAHL